MTNAVHSGDAITKRACLYLRVSTASRSKYDNGTFNQNPAVQEQPLRELITQRHWQLYRVYSDRASGAKERRPGLDALMADARRGAFDMVLVFRFDRFARSVKQLIQALEEFRALGIDFVSHQEALDTSTPMGKAMFTIIAAMAELERSVIRERIMAGMEYTRLRGTKSGKPIGRPRAIFRRDEARIASPRPQLEANRATVWRKPHHRSEGLHGGKRIPEPMPQTRRQGFVTGLGCRSSDGVQLTDHGPLWTFQKQ